jgi:hypothetical protein
VSYQVNWEIQALDQTAGFLRDDPTGVAALWETVGRLADEPRPPESRMAGSGSARARSAAWSRAAAEGRAADLRRHCSGHRPHQARHQRQPDHDEPVVIPLDVLVQYRRALCQLLESVGGTLYPVYPHDGDQVPFDLIQHPVRTDAQPTVGAADERAQRRRIVS